MVTYTHDEIPDALRQRFAAIRPEADVADIVAVGLEQLRDRLCAYTDVGFSKLVLVPLQEPDDWRAELDRVGDAVLDLHN